MNNKQTAYKRSELVLYVFNELINGRDLTIQDVIRETGVSRQTAYNLFVDIDIFISDFEQWDLELIKDKKKYKLIRRK